MKQYSQRLICNDSFAFNTFIPASPHQVNNHIFPVWTYSYLSVLVPVFLLTDWLRYKPVLVFQCAMLFITTAMLLWTKSVPAMQAMQFFYGVVTASDVAYFSYIYRSCMEVQKTEHSTSVARCQGIEFCIAGTDMTF